MTIVEAIVAPPAAAPAKPALWRETGFAEDRFARVADNDAIAPGTLAIVSVARWMKERDALIGRNEPIGLIIQPSDTWQAVAADLHRFAVIVLTIPKYADGRAFSIARLLREREKFGGEIRAAGDYIIDQVPMMRRVGFDAFETTNTILKRQLAEGEWPEVGNYLQPVGEHEVPAGTRPWTRRTDRVGS